MYWACVLCLIGPGIFFHSLSSLYSSQQPCEVDTDILILRKRKLQDRGLKWLLMVRQQECIKVRTSSQCLSDSQSNTLSSIPHCLIKHVINWKNTSLCSRLCLEPYGMRQKRVEHVYALQIISCSQCLKASPGIPWISHGLSYRGLRNSHSRESLRGGGEGGGRWWCIHSDAFLWPESESLLPSIASC